MLGHRRVLLRSPAVADTSWWLAGGISASDCIAAYQPKGAASYAASKVNLANPGTHDATDGTTYPSWGASDGWVFDGSGKYLATDIIPIIVTNLWSAIVKISGGGTGRFLYGTNDSSYREFGFRAINSTTMNYANGKSVNKTVSDAYNGVFAIAGLGAYADGNLLSGDIPLYPAYPCGKIHFGARVYAYGTKDQFYTGKVQAAAIYNTVLTSAQVSALTTAMSAL